MTTEQRLTTPPPHVPPDGPDKPKLDLSVTQVLGGALAAMTAAYLGSRLSVAGTVAGAAVASVVAAVAGSVYTASLRTTQARVRTVFRGRPAAGDRPRLPWKTVLLSALAAFLLAAIALTGLELATGSSLSGEQGTTVTQVTEPRQPAPQNDPSPSATSPSASPSSASPSASPSPSETPSAAPTSSVDETPVPAPLPSEPAPSSSSPASVPTPSAPSEIPTPEPTG